MAHRVTISVLLFFVLAACSAAAGPYYARGSFYAGTGEIWGYDEGNELFDDGLHDDGAAGDGVYAAWIIPDQDAGWHDWKIGNADWSELFPHHPIYTLNNAVLYQNHPNEPIHFRLDTNTLGDGWQPAAGAVSCSHFCPPGMPFELIGSAPELGSWLVGVPIVMGEHMWTASIGIAEPGNHEYKWRVVGSWDWCNLGIHYNMFIGDNFTFASYVPGTICHFEYNLLDGRSRVWLEEPVAVDRMAWDGVKSLFR